MPFIKSTQTDQANPEKVKIFYQDIGQGKPVVLIHGWPLNYEMWEYQLNELPKHNMRIIAYDRRGFGRSSRPWNGYDYDSLATDLKILIDELDLRDVTLVGFSMGGGEVAQYLSKYNTEGRVTKAVFVSAVTPYLLKTDDNPDGLPKEQFNSMQEQIEDDRPKFLASFGKMFYGVNVISHPVSSELLQHDAVLAMNSSGYATIKTLQAWSLTDFRQDLKNVNVKTLIIHGKDDKTVPIESSSDITAKLIPHAEYIIYDDAPHGLFVTHKEKFNDDIKRFVNS